MRAKYRISIITLLPSPYQRDLFEALASRGDVDLTVYYLESTMPDASWPGQAKEALLAPYEHVLPGVWVSLRGARIHFHRRVPRFDSEDYVIMSNYTSFTAQWLMRSRLRGRRWLFWGEILREQEVSWRKSAQEMLLAPLYRATAIVGMGSVAERDYRRRFPSLRHFSIPYYCDISSFSGSAVDLRSEGQMCFCFCGQMIHRKGVDLLLAAFQRLINDGFDVKLLLIGREAMLPGFLNEITPETRSHISYAGFQPTEKLPEFFARSDIFVLPSRHDGWGVVINQAVGAGLPVLTSDAAGAGFDLVEHNVNGLRFAAGDVNALYDAMKRACSSRELLRSWREASRRKAITITPFAGAQKWVEVFDQLSNRRDGCRA